MNDILFILLVAGMYVVIHGIPVWRDLFVKGPVRKQVKELMNDLDDLARRMR